MEKIRNLVPKAKNELTKRRQFVTYSLIGICGLTIDLGLFFLLFNVAHIDKLIANTVSTVLAVTNNFFWNSIFTFKIQDKWWWWILRLISFYGVAFTGYLLTQAMFLIFSDVLKIDPNIVKLTSIPIVLVMQYNLNRIITFRKFGASI